jgi:hypothetical protein
MKKSNLVPQKWDPPSPPTKKKGEKKRIKMNVKEHNIKRGPDDKHANGLSHFNEERLGGEGNRGSQSEL